MLDDVVFFKRRWGIPSKILTQTMGQSEALHCLVTTHEPHWPRTITRYDDAWNIGCLSQTNMTLLKQTQSPWNDNSRERVHHTFQNLGMVWRHRKRSTVCVYISVSPVRRRFAPSLQPLPTQLRPDRTHGSLEPESESSAARAAHLCAAGLGTRPPLA